jgi:hypothetical protein
MLETFREGLRSLSGSLAMGRAAIPASSYDDNHRTTPVHGLQSRESTTSSVFYQIECGLKKERFEWFDESRVVSGRRRREGVLNVSDDR